MNNLTNRIRPKVQARAPKSGSALECYWNEIRDLPKVTAQEEQLLAERIQNGDGEAVKILVNAHLKFVVAVCRNYENQGLTMGDLISEGNLGLIRAARRYLPGMNCKFISYAVWWIRQGILIALAEQSRFLRISPGAIKNIQRVNRMKISLEQKLGRAPSLEDLAEALECSVTQITNWMDLTTPPVSLSEPSVGNESASLRESLVDRDGTPPDESTRRMLMETKVRRHLESLSTRERQVLTLYYGIGLETTYALDQIAVRMGLTRERIRQIKIKALENLSHPSRQKTLEPLQRMHFAKDGDATI